MLPKHLGSPLPDLRIGGQDEQGRVASGKVPPRPRVSAEGIVVGDFYLAPRLVFGTDGSNDDVNGRERALRDERDAQEAKRRGEITEDGLSHLLRRRAQGQPRGPGFQLASMVRQALQSAVTSISLKQQRSGGPSADLTERRNDAVALQPR